MKKLLIAALLALAPGALAADPVHGMWKTQPDDGSYAYINIAECNGGKVCGWMMRSFYEGGAEYQSENLGKALVRNMENVGGGRYEGSVWRPSNDKIYVGKMELNGNTLYLDGCVLGGLICKTQTWTRVQ